MMGEGGVNQCTTIDANTTISANTTTNNNTNNNTINATTTTTTNTTTTKTNKTQLIIGNYSDGNLVGSLLAAQQQQHAEAGGETSTATLVTIAHALEKTKYADADVNWRSMEPTYHFSCQVRFLGVLSGVWSGSEYLTWDSETRWGQTSLVGHLRP